MGKDKSIGHVGIIGPDGPGLTALTFELAKLSDRIKNTPVILVDPETAEQKALKEKRERFQKQTRYMHTSQITKAAKHLTYKEKKELGLIKK